MQPMLKVGFNNYISSENSIGIFNPNTQPIVNLILKAKNENKVINLTSGNKRKSVILLFDSSLIISTISTKTVYKRYLEDIFEINKSEYNIGVLKPMFELGFGNYVFSENVNSILEVKGQAIIKLIKTAKQNNNIIDLTYGKKRRTAITLFNGMIILSTLDAKTIKDRYMKNSKCGVIKDESED